MRDPELQVRCSLLTAAIAPTRKSLAGVESHLTLDGTRTSSSGYSEKPLEASQGERPSATFSQESWMGTPEINQSVG